MCNEKLLTCLKEMYKNVRNISHSFRLDYRLIFAREGRFLRNISIYIYIYNTKVECASIQPKQAGAILNNTMLMTK